MRDDGEAEVVRDRVRQDAGAGRGARPGAVRRDEPERAVEAEAAAAGRVARGGVAPGGGGARDGGGGRAGGRVRGPGARGDALRGDLLPAHRVRGFRLPLRPQGHLRAAGRRLLRGPRRGGRRPGRAPAVRHRGLDAAPEYGPARSTGPEFGTPELRIDWDRPGAPLPLRDGVRTPRRGIGSGRLRHRRWSVPPRSPGRSTRTIRTDRADRARLAEARARCGTLLVLRLGGPGRYGGTRFTVRYEE